MSNSRDKADADKEAGSLRSETRLERVVTLARTVLKEHGLSDFQIDALLNRSRAPDPDRRLR